MGRRAAWFAVVTLLASLGWVVQPAKAANWLEMNFWMSGPKYDGVLPACEAGLDTVASRFAQKESQYWNSDIAIRTFDKVREIAYRPWAANTIPRRFCSATAYLTDGHHAPVYYSIGEDTGFIGATWGVEWCVVGYDRNLAYNPACKMAAP